MSWPFPEDGQDPWYDALRSFADFQDASAYAAREDRHILLMEGGTVTWTASTGIVTWSDPIEVLAAITGFRWSIPAGSLTLQDGEMGYLELVRSPTQDLNLTFNVARQAPPSDQALLMCIRRGTRVYWRDGYVLNDGDVVLLFSSLGGGATGPAGGDLAGTYPNPTVDGLQNRPVAATAPSPGEVLTWSGAQWAPAVGGGGGGVVTSLGVTAAQFSTNLAPQVIGNFELDASAFASVRFLTVGYVSGGGVTGTIELFNLTDVTSEYIETFTGVTTPTRRLSGALTLPGSAKMYEVRARLTVGVPFADIVFAQWAGFELT
jgi:hypothetical protein